ncbi:hypothetical protein pEaSNUABM28_00337 [Erwinia phage pEa_SNUABM_28]|uniref:Uncharacterized protein n=1 Tax=Erwinia phage pEa_SNUABM_16 TaxID=2869544 RepID=A0AAE8XR66_9CAUD|nr:hypothetical protein MPK64_gp335 [Erwinia phage pEa_SNUABM_16]QZE58894.1 hypothetical protein pEaSNUABM28_00337 [Erwinia phage pEa_SNUABM_28]QZE59235.1 hypothetical protein pEaSNUABM18_00332 [Erwinia phage pEa_SNUABM_18]UAW96479.1 hypothetical protein pEaSNUABM16_00335 [Erwinia phage pEa_SNUABM_16]
MSAEHLLNDDLPDDSLVVPALKQDKPSYYDLMTLRLEAGARLARSLKTLVDARVIHGPALNDLLPAALRIAETHWADICNGLTPVHDESNKITLVGNLPACIEAFRIVVMEHAQRNALELECRNMVAHDDGFKLLTRPQLLHIEPKHVCDGNCDHDSKTV